MATFAPQPPVPRPLPTDFTPSSPPDRLFHANAMLNDAQETVPSLPANGTHRVQHQRSIDFKANGHVAGLVNGKGGMPVPNGVHHHIPNPGSRHRGTVSMGAFDGARSPPSTKSMSHGVCGVCRTRKRSSLANYRYLTCAVQVLQDRSVSSWQSLSFLTFNGIDF